MRCCAEIDRSLVGVFILAANGSRPLIDGLGPEIQTFYAEKSLTIEPNMLFEAVSIGLEVSRQASALESLAARQTSE